MLRDVHEITVDGCPVRVVGESGVILTTWSLYEGDRLLERYKAPGGMFDLSGTLSSGTEVDAAIEHDGLGPTRITVHADDEMVLDTEGFVL